jgi:hypothetical protein
MFDDSEKEKIERFLHENQYNTAARIFVFFSRVGAHLMRQLGFSKSPTQSAQTTATKPLSDAELSALPPHIRAKAVRVIQLQSQREEHDITQDARKVLVQSR